uniref:Uncharacterized protein n=1 Tax=Podoviridae sp. ctzMH52 TaxID=2826596 RepID=A0A8S5N3A0_9CAUD|nr:MAG TPA: hypothetical protein [Podoviridae sp. ctzMH52]
MSFKEVMLVTLLVGAMELCVMLSIASLMDSVDEKRRGNEGKALRRKVLGIFLQVLNMALLQVFAAWITSHLTV